MLFPALPCGSEELTLKHLGKSLEHLGTEANNPPSSLDFGQDRRSGGRCAEPPPGPGCVRYLFVQSREPVPIIITDPAPITGQTHMNSSGSGWWHAQDNRSASVP
ncbi:uncharacterized protein CLUP02_08773 [Colletotrichum lupini]|uniref:Uncharacterized protein n=1 Tax=Colletotrichum lupini TaxID=145971 RepID=A0A9Q8STE9_9PEZI|nr:uncharacterized protein CLUP02_08773 [Colletotrichum lupini]UQC83279.1 hypothetical protein CLUP02_08773 [Colletotrichum lupini]